MNKIIICSALTSFLTVVVGCVKLSIVIRDLNTGDNQVVLLIRSVCAQHQAMNHVVLSLRPAQ